MAVEDITMFTETTEIVTVPVFPVATFTSLTGKTFCIPRDSILHAESYCTKDAQGNEVVDNTKTYVNFKSPNPKSKGPLHTVVDMPVEVFRDQIWRPTYEGNRNAAS